MGAARGPQTTDLVVALGLDAARETAGEDRRLRDADAERLCDDAERTALANHAHDLVLRRALAAGTHGAEMLDAVERRKLGRITQHADAQPLGVESEMVADVLKGIRPAQI